jgi:6-phosphogluconolactonase (cycloisomerase 2 family)
MIAWSNGRRGLGAAAAFTATILAVTGISLAAKGELSFQQRVPEFDIDRASSLTVSPDGKHLYATGSGGNSISAFSIDPGGDDYSFVETETDGVDDSSDAGGAVDGLFLADDAAVSPDGEHVYVVGRLDDAIAIFDRDSSTGELSFSEAARDTIGTDELDRPEGVAVSGDGDYVYAVSNLDDSILTFKRDPGDGSLTQVEVETDGVDDAGDAGGTVDGMNGPSSVAVAPDGEAVYVGTEDDDSLAAFSRDAGTGELSFVEFEQDGVDDAGDAGGTVDGLNSVEDVAVSGDNDNVYATGSSDSAVAVFDRDTATEELSFSEVERNGVDDPGDLGGTVSGLGSPRELAISADDRNLYIAGRSTDSVANFRRNATTGKLNFLESESNGSGAVDGLEGASVVAVGTDDANVYVGAESEGGLAVFDRGAAPGALSFVGTRPDFPQIAQPPGVAISPDGKHLVVLSWGKESLYSAERDPSDGTFELRDTETDAVDDPSDSGGTVEGLYESSSVTFSPDGKHVYVTAYSIYSIATFALDPATGELTYIETEADGVDDPTDPGGTVTGLYEPYSVVVSPDGKSVYAPADTDDGLAAFSRDAATGKLNFVEAEFDGVGGVEGLVDADSVAISPDGKNLYVGAGSDEAVAVFSRDPATSALSFVEVQQGTGSGGSVAELESVDDIAVSANGEQLYAVGDSKLLRFDRNAATGALTFAEVEEDGVSGVSGLNGVATVELSADGEEVYAAGGSSPGSIAIFSRNPASGALSFLEAEVQGVDDPGDAGPAPTGLRGILALAISPDDRFLYAAAEDDNSLTILSREDDFDPPQTTITGGPANGAVTSDSTPSFTYSSSEAGSSFECSTDGGAFGACAASLPELSDGEHSFEVAATDPAGNEDPTPAAREFTVDTKLKGGKVKAKEKQKQKGSKIKVKIKLTAGEAAEGLGKGEIKIGKKSYKLKKKTKDLKADKTKKLTLKPKKSKDKKKIEKKLKKGKKVTAKLTGKITDEVGNKFKKKKTVTLKKK